MEQSRRGGEESGGGGQAEVPGLPHCRKRRTGLRRPGRIRERLGRGAGHCARRRQISRRHPQRRIARCGLGQVGEDGSRRPAQRSVHPAHQCQQRMDLLHRSGRPQNQDGSRRGLRNEKGQPHQPDDRREAAGGRGHFVRRRERRRVAQRPDRWSPVSAIGHDVQGNLHQLHPAP